MKHRIFLVEDNADTRFLLSHLLERSGHEVHVADSIDAARRDFPDAGCDVLVSDIGLADGSGYDLMKELQRGGHPPYGIAMSGFGAAVDIAASLEAGFRHHLVKPIRFEVLEGLIEAVGDAPDASP